MDSVSGNVNSILDAEKKKADADKLAADVLTKRTRARQLLEEEQKIRDLCVKLGREDCQVP